LASEGGTLQTDARGREHPDPFGDGAFDRDEQKVAERGEASAVDNEVRGESADHVRRGETQVLAGASEKRAALREAGHFGDGNGAGEQCGACEGQGRSAGERFETAAAAAGAGRSVGFDDLVTEFARGAEWAEAELAINDHSTSDACAEGIEEHVGGGVPEAKFAKGRCAGVIEDTDGDAE